MKKTKKKKGRPKLKVYPKLYRPTAEELFAALAESKVVEIDHIGIFEIVKIPRKIIFHNFSKRKRVIHGYNKLKFTQSPELKKLLV